MSEFGLRFFRVSIVGEVFFGIDSKDICVLFICVAAAFGEMFFSLRSFCRARLIIFFGTFVRVVIVRS